MTAYIVEIFNLDTGAIIRQFPCSTKRKAEKVQAGVEINLSPDYDTRIIERREGGE